MKFYTSVLLEPDPDSDEDDDIEVPNDPVPTDDEGGEE